MNEDLDNIKFRQIKEINFNKLFPEYKSTDVVLNSIKRRQVVKDLDKRIKECVDGLEMINANLEEMKSERSDFTNIIEPIYNFCFFTSLTTADCLVVFKYFLLANTDYDRKFMYGKLKVILNEGFKKLYGYNDSNKEKSEWRKISKIVSAFPYVIQRQHAMMERLLERKSQISTWWKYERNNEVHIDAFKLYDSRNEIINQSQVMLDSTQLLNALDATNQFVENLNICVLNTLLDKYKKGELREQQTT